VIGKGCVRLFKLKEKKKKRKKEKKKKRKEEKKKRRRKEIPSSNYRYIKSILNMY